MTKTVRNICCSRLSADWPGLTLRNGIGMMVSVVTITDSITVLDAVVRVDFPPLAGCHHTPDNRIHCRENRG